MGITKLHNLIRFNKYVRWKSLHTLRGLGILSRMKDNVVCLYNGILLNHKTEWNNTICSNMDETRDYHTRWSKPDRERQISYDITYMWNLKKWWKWYKWTYIQDRNRPTDTENKLMVTNGESGGGIN